MAVEAATVGVFAVLHLTGALQIGASGRSYGAGVAESLICLALVGGAVALVRLPARPGRRRALAALCFAILGFIVGLSFTLGSSDVIDLAYHLIMLPILVATAVLLAGHQGAARDL